MTPLLLMMMTLDFQPKDVVTGLKMGYQLVVADLNRDGKKDLIVIDERSTELAWYENPTWTRHVLATDVPRTINVDFADLNGDGIPEMALAHNFESTYERSIGTVLLMQAGSDVRQPWTRKEIDKVPTAHRVRWMRTRKNGPLTLIVAPLEGRGRRAVLIYAYEPRAWQRRVICADLTGVLHSIAPVDWNRGDHVQRLLTASFDGISLLEPRDKGLWKRQVIATGDPRPCPECGSSEIKMGWLGKQRFLAAIEPWHGNQVVVYEPDGKKWERKVLDKDMVNGHALAVGDLDGDGNDEIVSGFRGKGFRVTVFRHGRSGWEPEVIDTGGVAAADCKIEDTNGDGRREILCSGASTGNVRIFSR